MEQGGAGRALRGKLELEMVGGSSAGRFRGASEGDGVKAGVSLRLPEHAVRLHVRALTIGDVKLLRVKSQHQNVCSRFCLRSKFTMEDHMELEFSVRFCCW